jgi:hypothetical protein
MLAAMGKLATVAASLRSASSNFPGKPRRRVSCIHVALGTFQLNPSTYAGSACVGLFRLRVAVPTWISRPQLGHAATRSARPLMSLVLLGVSGLPRRCVSACALLTHLHLSTRLGLRLRSSLGLGLAALRLAAQDHSSGCRRRRREFVMDFFACDKDACVDFFGCHVGLFLFSSTHCIARLLSREWLFCNVCSVCIFSPYLRPPSRCFIFSSLVS